MIQNYENVFFVYRLEVQNQYEIIWGFSFVVQNVLWNVKRKALDIRTMIMIIWIQRIIIRFRATEFQGWYKYKTGTQPYAWYSALWVTIMR